MSGVSNGQDANEDTFNDAFMDRNGDTDTIGIVDLLNGDAPSGPSVLNLQREINSLNTFTNRPSASDFDATPVWVNNDVGSSSDGLQDRAEALTEKFNNTTGHAHDGTSGNGVPIDGPDVVAPLQGFTQKGTDLTGVTGTTTDVSSQLSTKPISSSSSVRGVPATAPYNKVFVRKTSDNELIEDLLGNEVYGRLTNSGGLGGTWTLSYYTNVAGVETAYTFSSTNISWWYQELFHPLDSDRPVYSQDFFIPSDNATDEVEDASATQSGKVNTTAQTFAGVKTFNSAPNLNSLTASKPLKLDGSKNITGAAINLADPTNEVTGTLGAGNGGTGQTTILAAFQSFFQSIASALGDLVYGGASGTPTRLAGNITTTRKFLRQVGDGANSAAPAWDTIQAGDVPTLNQNTTGTSSNITGVAAIANGGTGQSTKALAFDALSPMSASGDMIYGGTSGTGTRLPKGTDGQWIKQVSGIPAWTDLPASGGGGGGSLQWILSGGNAPTPVEDAQNNRVMLFQAALGQAMYCAVKVPQGYTAGLQIKLYIPYYSPDASGNVLLKTVATLIRNGTDAITSTTNQRTSTNAATTLTNANRLLTHTCDLTASDGKINSVAVAAGDLILVQLTRDATDTATSDVSALGYGAEVTFNG